MNVSGLSSIASLYASALSRGQRATDASGVAKAGSEGGQQGLTPEELKQVAELKSRDREVRQHEQAHMAAGGGLVTSGASYSYQKGPDGVNYAIGGEVGISTSPGRTPEETIQRARQIKAAALAPADPSGQDRAVAAQAAQMEQGARLEQAQAANAARQETSGSRSEALARTYGMTESGNAAGFSAYA
ncbi:putative metalloprotease CJM1_0395 family protein [Ferribacterium limneticum]|uniref:putative metalloprotease CJM1_0395 family protein n=1 Tax=Ferribacterium limneticum TaxID=76259 RepID=UPI001CFC29F6|nr:putative metalloprotease CJM1_0395 family protein [Ferribacterium limneticum]UCV19506.1 catalase [Ferribacterium limneticum]